MMKHDVTKYSIVWFFLHYKFKSKKNSSTMSIFHQLLQNYFSIIFIISRWMEWPHHKIHPIIRFLNLSDTLTTNPPNHFKRYYKLQVHKVISSYFNHVEQWLNIIDETKKYLLEFITLISYINFHSGLSFVNHNNCDLLPGIFSIIQIMQIYLVF